MCTVDEKLLLAELVRNMREAVVSAGAASATEIEDLAGRVERAARDPGLVFHQARIQQVWARRPE